MENEVKEPAPKYNYVSPEQYLELEGSSVTKHEYYDGEIFAMAGASNAHNDIAYNINRIIAPFLQGKGCKLYGSDFRVHVPEHLLFTYPDFSIVCGKAETSEVYTDNLTNPAVIVEILSASTRDYDRGTKFTFYRSIKTLKEYILIDSLSINVEIFTKQPNNSWNLKEYKQFSDRFLISSINFQICLQDIYDDVRFEESISLYNELREDVSKYNFMSPDEYLVKERHLEYKNEYYFGKMIAMSPANIVHNNIIVNFYSSMAQDVKRKSCSLLGSNMRIGTPDRQAYMYSDALIVGDEPELEDDEMDTLTNPIVIFEIVSPSARSIDKGGKFFFYRQIPSLHEYIMIDSSKRFVQIERKQQDGAWRLDDIPDSASFFRIESIGFNFSLDELYHDTGL